MKLIEKFKELKKTEKNVCFLYTGDKNGKNILAWNPIAKFQYKMGEKNNFHQFLQKNKNHKLIGFFSYDLAYEIYNIKQTAEDDLKLPDIYFLAFDKWLEEKSSKNIFKIQPREKSGKFKPAQSRKSYTDAYKKVKKYIKEGDIYQINLTHRLEAKTKQNSKDLFLRIIEKNPVEFLAYIEGENFKILSASPERFIQIKDRHIESCPIKGTRPRGKTETEDQKLKKELLKSPKETAELNMITDLLRNDLGKISEIGTVKVKGSRLIKKCPTVWHTYSKITGKLKKEFSPIEGLLSMLPGGSITGCPKKRAIEIIDELEPKTRSIYTGVIGHIDPNQDLDFNIAIRTIIKKGENLYLQVGGGIVNDSNNKDEYNETLQKAKSFMEIL